MKKLILGVSVIIALALPNNETSQADHELTACVEFEACKSLHTSLTYATDNHTLASLSDYRVIYRNNMSKLEKGSYYALVHSYNVPIKAYKIDSKDVKTLKLDAKKRYVSKFDSKDAKKDIRNVLH